MKGIAAATLIFFAGPTFADGLTYIPKWHMANNEACYSFDDAKRLTELDAKLVLCDAYQANNRTYEAALGEFKLSLQNADQQIAELRGANDSYVTQLMKCVQEKNDFEAKANSSFGIGWLVAGGVALTAIGVIVGILVAKK